MSPARLGLGQRRGGGVGSPPPPYSPPDCRTPLGVTHWLAAAPVIFQIQPGIENMQTLTEILQCLPRWRHKVSIGHTLAIQGVRALSCACFQKQCTFYGALGLGVCGCTCARSAPQVGSLGDLGATPGTPFVLGKASFEVALGKKVRGIRWCRRCTIMCWFQMVTSCARKWK